MQEKILVVDDSVEVRDRFYEIFSSLWYKATCVPSGSEALIRLKEERFDLILLDESMPDSGGIDTAKKIRGFDKDAKIILLCDNEPAQGTKELAAALNIQAAVKKDFSTHLMMKNILEVLKEREPPGPARAPADKTKGPVLVVDDNSEVRAMLESFLAKSGYKVFTASSGEDALMKVKAEKPRIVLLDVRMPGMDGIMVLRQIKQLDESAKVVMLTSAGEEFIIEQARKEGASDYLIKPCDLQKLDALLTSILLQR